MSLKVAVCQVPDIREDIERSMQWIEHFTTEADANRISLVCFPECFLQGYLTEKGLAEKEAIDLGSPAFAIILKRLAIYKVAIVVGLIEKENGNLFNTAVIIKDGKLMGIYRKTHLLEGEQLFKAGIDYPVFEIKGLKFGINICYDTQFPEAVANIAKQGAQLILCPSNNMMRYQTAERYKYLHHEMRMERVKENKIWLLSSDVTGERDGRIGYGPSSAINPLGEIVAQVPLESTGMAAVEIS